MISETARKPLTISAFLRIKIKSQGASQEWNEQPKKWQPLIFQTQNKTTTHVKTCSNLFPIAPICGLPYPKTSWKSLCLCQERCVYLLFVYIPVVCCFGRLCSRIHLLLLKFTIEGKLDQHQNSIIFQQISNEKLPGPKWRP